METTPLPSRTSILVAAARALGAREPDPSVRNPDWLAERLLGPEELELIQAHPLSRALSKDYGEAVKDPYVIGLMLLLIVRTRYIDERLQRAVQNGAIQVAILGAGFDTRAYRFQDLLSGATVIEVDSQPTQALKKHRIEAVAGNIPRNLTFAPADFRVDDLSDVLRRAGYQPNRKTFFVWEGVSMYVDETSVRKTLSTIAGISEPGSSLVMDYAAQGALGLTGTIGQAGMAKNLETWREPWLFGVPDGRERDFFAENQMEAVELMGLLSADAIRRYLTRADGSIVGLPPGTSQWSPPDGSGSMGTAAAAVNASWYSIAELKVINSSITHD
jgi:methyltransferase (TIGR00027 family)